MLIIYNKGKQMFSIAYLHLPNFSLKIVLFFLCSLFAEFIASYLLEMPKYSQLLGIF